MILGVASRSGGQALGEGQSEAQLYAVFVPKRPATFASFITLHDGVALVPLLNVTRQMRRFLFSREGFPIEDRVRPVNMVMNLRHNGLAHTRFADSYACGERLAPKPQCAIRDWKRQVPVQRAHPGTATFSSTSSKVQKAFKRKCPHTGGQDVGTSPPDSLSMRQDR